MSGKLLQFGGNPHDESMRLLPWLLNGTLDAEARAFVDGHLQGCARCRAELDALRGVQAVCERTDGEVLPPPAFERLRARIEADEPRPAPSLRARLSALANGWRMTPGWLRAVACAQAALLLAFVAGWWLLRNPATTPQPAYRTLGSGAGTGVVAPGEVRLLLVFAPQTEQGSVSRLLRASGARIVDGPSDAGAYVVAVAARRAAAARDALRAADGVQLVEVLGPEAPQ